MGKSAMQHQEQEQGFVYTKELIACMFDELNTWSPIGVRILRQRNSVALATTQELAPDCLTAFVQ